MGQIIWNFKDVLGRGRNPQMWPDQHEIWKGVGILPNFTLLGGNMSPLRGETRQITL